MIPMMSMFLLLCVYCIGEASTMPRFKRSDSTPSHNRRESRLKRRPSLSFLPDYDEHDKPSYESAVVVKKDPPAGTRKRTNSFYEAVPEPVVVVAEPLILHIENQLKSIIQQYSSESWKNSEYSYKNRVARFVALSGVASPRVEAVSPRLLNQAYTEAMNFIRIALSSDSSNQVNFSRQINSFFTWLATRFSPLHVSRIASRCLHTLQNGL